MRREEEKIYMRREEDIYEKRRRYITLHHVYNTHRLHSWSHDFDQAFGDHWNICPAVFFFQPPHAFSIARSNNKINYININIKIWNII